MKKILSFLVFSALAPLFALGQGSQLPRYTVATLPVATTQPHYIVQVIDGATASDCTTGGGVFNVLCTPVAGVWAATGGTPSPDCPTLSGIITCADPIAAGTINGVLSADQFSGVDIGAKINAAFASCTPSSTSSCVVTLPPNQAYTYATTIVIPAIASSGPDGGSPILELNGASLTYTGTGDALVVAPRFSSQTLSGELRNGTIFAGNSATSIVHTQSIVGFTMDRVALVGGGSTAVCLKMENVLLAGAQLWTERNRIDITEYGCSKGVQLVNNGGTNSFMYNTWNVISSLNGQNQTAFSVEGAISTNGSTLDITANTYGSAGNLDNVVSATGGATAVFTSLNIRGESDGSANDCSIYIDSSSVIGAVGSYLGANFHTCSSGVSSQTTVAANSQAGITNLQGHADQGFEQQPGWFAKVQAQARNCKTDILNGLTPDPGSMAFGLANPSGFATSACYFEIYKRTTTDAYPEVNIPGASGNPVVSIVFADSYSGYVGIGSGFGWNGTAFVLPQYPLDVKGFANASSGFKVAGNTVIPATVTSYQGTDSNLLTAGVISGVGTTLCSDGNGGASTTSCLTGMTTLVSGTATVTSGGAYIPSSTERYRLTNCGANGSTAIGVLSLGTVVAGVSFVINSLSATNTVVTGDKSIVCWEILIP